MKKSELKIGMKVVPISKSILASMQKSRKEFPDYWEVIDRQGYGVITSVYREGFFGEGSSLTVSVGIDENSSGNLYLPSDLKPYRPGDISWNELQKEFPIIARFFRKHSGLFAEFKQEYFSASAEWKLKYHKADLKEHFSYYKQSSITYAFSWGKAVAWRFWDERDDELREEYLNG